MFHARHAHEDRFHQSLRTAGLEFPDVITWEQIPMKQEDDNVLLQSWPLILPHVLVMAPGARANTC